MVHLIEKKIDVHAKNLGEISRLMQEFKGNIVRCRLEKCPKNIKRELNRRDPFEVVASMKKVGVWLVYLEGPSCDQVVVVSIESGNQYIVDSEEVYPVELIANILKACGGSGADKIRLKECRPMRLEQNNNKGK